MHYNLFVNSNFSKCRKIHLIGIGGIGMSAIAKLLYLSGYHVQGSDIVVNDNTKKLLNLGIKIFLGHSFENLVDVDCVVYSTAIKEDNEELSFAIKGGKKIFHRSDIISQFSQCKRTVAISGSHGKTTTTGMIAAICDFANLEQTVIIGGIVNAYDDNIKIGKGNLFIVEIDESDGSMLNINPDIIVVTNIDNEHLEYYKTTELIEKYFYEFVSKVPQGGCLVLHIDISKFDIQRLPCQKIIYGINESADIMAINIRHHGYKTFFDLVINCKMIAEDTVIKNIELSSLGMHNICNSLAAISVAIKLGISVDSIKGGLAKFSGIRRRFSLIGKTKTVRFFDDYGHHPREIEASLGSAKLISEGRIICVIQPHRFTRVRDLFEQFIEVLIKFDSIIIMNVYSAGENKILGFTSDDLRSKIILAGFSNIQKSENAGEVTDIINNMIQEYDIFIFFGAGDITDIAYNVARNVKKMHNDL